MKERVYHLRKEILGLSRRKFGEPLGMTDSEIKNIETGATVLKESKIPLLCKVYGVNRHWLETGEGEMFAEKSEIEEITDFMADLTNPTDDEELQQAKRDFIKAIAKLSPEEWKVLTKIAKDWQGK